MAFFLARGEAVTVSRDICPGWVRIYKSDQRFLGVGCVTEESMLTPKRIVRME